MTNESQKSHQRSFFHCFPRPKRGEQKDQTLARGLSILAFMKRVGLILAPEIVHWDVSILSPEAPPVNLLQRRISFTELALSELTEHSAIFGPISFSVDIAKLRAFGAIPVIYVPQGSAGNPFTQIPTFCVNGMHHTKYVLSQLQQLKEASDRDRLSAHFKMPVVPECTITLKNTDASGKGVAEYNFRISEVADVLKYGASITFPSTIALPFLDIF